MTDIHNDYDAPVQYAFRFLCSVCGRVDEKAINVRSGEMVFKPWPGSEDDIWTPLYRRWICGAHKLVVTIDGEQARWENLPLDSLCPPVLPAKSQ